MDDDAADDDDDDLITPPRVLAKLLPIVLELLPFPLATLLLFFTFDLIFIFPRILEDKRLL